MRKYEIIKDDDYGFFKISPTPTKEEIAKYYSDEFYSSINPAQINDSSLDVQSRDKEFYDAWREDLRQIIEQEINKEIVSIYDFGCGWCETLSFFNQYGYDCYGIDTAPEAIAYGIKQGFNVSVSDLENINPFKRKFDVVLMQNVLEHLASPKEIMSSIFNEVLNDGGLIIIDVPNEFNEFQVTAKEVNDLDEWWVAPPAHLNYFNPASLKALLEGVGFTIVDEFSSFPLEMFLLMGDNYVGDSKLGRECHLKRMLFEENLRKSGRVNILHNFYRSLAKQNLGRQILTIAKKV